MESKLHKYIGRWILVFVMLLIHLSPLHAQLVDVPVEVQYPLLLKILTFDRNFNKKINKELKIGILYQEESSNSVNIKNELITIIQNSSLSSVQSKPVTFEIIKYTENTDLAVELKKKNINVLYVTPMRMIPIKEISNHCKQLGVLTFSGVSAYIKAGLSVGITLKADKPDILINVKSAKAEGSDFDSRLLKISRIIE